MLPAHSTTSLTLAGLLLGQGTPAASAQEALRTPYVRLCQSIDPAPLAARFVNEPREPGTGRPCAQVTWRACRSSSRAEETCVRVRNACAFRIEVIVCFDARRCGMETVDGGVAWQWCGEGTPLISASSS